MKIITVNLPLSYIRAIASLTGEGGLYPSRSELIRIAVREYLIRELESAKQFMEFQDQLSPNSQEEKEKEEEKKILEIPPKKGPELDIHKIWGIVPDTPYNKMVLNQANKEVQEYADHFIISGKKMWKK